MSTAQILFKQYQALPPRIRRELKELIDEEEEDNVPVIEQIREGMKEIKLIRQGKLKAKSADDFLAELRSEIRNEH